jgi:hypothetical protein
MSARSEIVARARALSGMNLGARAGRLARRLEPTATLSFEDVAAAPDWILWPEVARRDLARAAGVAACASRLRRTIDGRALRIFAEAVGADRLDALLAAPALDGEAAGALPHDVETLSALGAAALRSEASDRPDLARRLAALLPASTETLDPATARAACAQARQWIAMNGEARP